MRRGRIKKEWWEKKERDEKNRRLRGMMWYVVLGSILMCLNQTYCDMLFWWDLIVVKSSKDSKKKKKISKLQRRIQKLQEGCHLRRKEKF